MTVIRSTNHSTAHALTAMILWLGSIHLNILLFLLFVIFCRTIIAFLYVDKYAPGYFPVTVHVENLRAFDQNKAYVLAAEPHSVFSIGCLSLMSFTGLMPLSKTKDLASTAMFHTPFLRQISTWMGLVPATKKNFIRYLETGSSCMIITGGVQEISFI
ncbi:putative Diacylglycerol O-acyltransferase [Cocos nucifera]|nr:putative Diacylglycerol O-acyltransferase [Cocos nucifera]